MDHYDEYMEHLKDAHTSAEKALNLLHDKDGPNRSMWYRMRVGRAQSALISLYVRELSRQTKKDQQAKGGSKW